MSDQPEGKITPAAYWVDCPNPDCQDICMNPNQPKGVWFLHELPEEKTVVCGCCGESFVIKKENRKLHEWY